MPVPVLVLVLVVVGEDEHTAAWGQVCHRPLDGVGILGLHMGRQLGRKQRLAAVHPGDVQRQVAQHLHQGCAYMPCPEHCHRAAIGGQALRQGLAIGLRNALKTQLHRTAAALTQPGTQRKTLAQRRATAGQQLACLAGRQPLQVAAANRAQLVLGKHGHPGTGIARCGSLCRLHLYQTGILRREAPQQLL